jgi:hypothetical protein
MNTNYPSSQELSAERGSPYPNEPNQETPRPYKGEQPSGAVINAPDLKHPIPSQGLGASGQSVAETANQPVNSLVLPNSENAIPQVADRSQIEGLAKKAEKTGSLSDLSNLTKIVNQQFENPN